MLYGIRSSAHHIADGDKVNVTINNYDIVVVVVVVEVGDNKTKYDDEHEVAVEHEINDSLPGLCPGLSTSSESCRGRGEHSRTVPPRPGGVGRLQPAAWEEAGLAWCGGVQEEGWRSVGSQQQ